ncbi:hypothetical protein ACVME8_008791 [Bradyrhizobium diazoefficiens]
MTETGNGGLHRPAEERVRANSGAGQNFNEVHRSGFDHTQIANMVDHGDEPLREWIAAHISSNDANDKIGIDPVLNRPTKALRSWGFDVEELNRSYALVILGGKAMVVNEQPFGPANDRVRFLPFEAMNSWFGNKFTEIVLPDGRIRPVTWAKAWHQHPDRRQYEGVEYFPNPDGANGTPNYLNLWRGFSVDPSSEGSCERYKEHLRVNVCAENEEHYRYLWGWMAHLIQKPRERPGIAVVLRGQKGTGKTVMGDVLGSLIEAHYFPVDDARYLTGQFNAHFASPSYS